MMGISKKFEQIFSAAAFAEEGEFETAREILRGGQTFAGKIKTLKSEVELSIDNLEAMAITFAEAGEHDKALEIMKECEPLEANNRKQVSTKESILIQPVKAN